MKAFAALSVLLTLGTASPVDIVRKDVADLEKRDTEIVYLANCIHGDSYYGNTYSSKILYYPTSAASQNGAVPSNDNQCSVTTSNYVAWEGNDNSCTFPTGVWFTSHIDAGAQGYSLYGWAGWSGSTYKNWNCYKDNGRNLFTSFAAESSDLCNSVYYCIPQ